MAETSGFFQAIWDSSLTNPITQEQTGWWDKSYIASEFANYFKLFVGNGVFGSPTNQLKVSPGTGLNVTVSAGWAFINGMWYHNDVAKTLAIPENSTSASRIDTIRVRYTAASRKIEVLEFAGDTTLVRGDSIYDLEIAQIVVPSNAESIAYADITDTRTDENVCGLVKGLMEVETTADLFAQYDSIFNTWFDGVKDQVTGDLAIRLQQEFDTLNGNVEDYQDAVEAQVDAAEGLVEDYVYNDYVIQEQEFVFINKVCEIVDAKIKATSLIDVYFTAATIGTAEEAQIVVDSSAGKITMTAAAQPNDTIRGLIRVRVN